jgi:hypothetical protein
MNERGFRRRCEEVAEILVEERRFSAAAERIEI